MGIGDPALPVGDEVPANHPVSRTGDDTTNILDGRLTVLERSGNAELARAVRYLFDVLSEPYPPP
jgi:hypothetical protein